MNNVGLVHSAHPIAGESPSHLSAKSRGHIDDLENEAIHIMREVAAECANPVLLSSGGKDSTVLLRLAEKAFRPGAFPFPLLHVDTGHNFSEVIEFRDRTVERLGERLIVRTVQDSIDQGRVKLKSKTQSRNVLQTVTLLDAIAEFGFDACIGGARRDEEKARAKERVFSFRDAFGQWDPRRQRPELWNLYNARLDAGENMRVFPISNWTELDVWQYIARENLELPSLYYAHSRPVAVRGDILVPVNDLMEFESDERIDERFVRFRTVGDVTSTLPVESRATDAAAVISETLDSRLSERGATRLDDQTSDSSMEERKKQGYF